MKGMSQKHGTTQLQSGGRGSKPNPPPRSTGKIGAAVVGKRGATNALVNPKGSLVGVRHGGRPASGKSG